MDNVKHQLGSMVVIISSRFDTPIVRAESGAQLAERNIYYDDMYLFKPFDDMDPACPHEYLDWQDQYLWQKVAYLKKDPRLRIRVRWDDEGIHVRDFKEPWANKHTDPIANSYWYDLSNNGALIERFILVSVDGARAELPLPNRNTLEVKPLIYKVAEVFDELDTLEKYMLSSGLSVKKT
jgi:hypothetical protein